MSAPGDARIVCLCGSTRFRDEILIAAREETLAGNIVLAPWVFSGAESESLDDATVASLTELHLEKISMADEILVIDVAGHVGESTTSEVEFAARLGKPIRYWSEVRSETPGVSVSPIAALHEAHRAQRLVTNEIPTLDVPPLVRELRCSLIEEEAAEFRASLEADDIVGVADAIGDLLTVVYGAALTFGIPVAEVFSEIHRSNMSKLGDSGEPILREDGKVMKGPNFSPPALLPILRRHGYRGPAESEEGAP